MWSDSCSRCSGDAADHSGDRRGVPVARSQLIALRRPEPLAELRPGPASVDRDGADVAGLQLAGHRQGGAQGHQPRLLHRTGPATEVERDAGLAGGLAGAWIDVHDHLADGAAEEAMERWRGTPPPTPRRCGRARAVPPGAACVSPCPGRGGWGTGYAVLAPPCRAQTPPASALIRAVTSTRKDRPAFKACFGLPPSWRQCSSRIGPLLGAAAAP